MTDTKKAASAFEAFTETVRKLRDPNGGCPWDLEQNHKTIRPYLIEEAYEVLDAIDSDDDLELKKELGDLLLQVVLHSQIASDRGAFEIADVVSAVDAKMIRRHPHVFGDVTAETSGKVVKNWEQIKLAEKKDEGKEDHSVLSGIPKALPALNRAQRIGEKAARFNFDWEDISGVLAKVEEEFLELKAELTSPEEGRKERLTHELGDLLFALSQLGRWLKVHSEDALREACDRFQGRFEKLEKLAQKPLKEHTIQELETLWQQVKRGGA